MVLQPGAKLGPYEIVSNGFFSISANGSLAASGRLPLS